MMRQMKSMIATPFCALLCALLAGCATAPKPQELLDLEQLREGKQYQEAEAKQATLIGEGDAAYKQAIAAWEGEELDQAKHWALLASIKVRTALTLIAQAAARQRIEQAQKKLAEMKSIHTQLVAQNKEADEQLRLHGELAQARKAADAKEAALKDQLTEAQKQQEAQTVVSAAQLALKMADTVEAEQYARTVYAVAQALLGKAEAALKEGKAAEASSMATAAKAKAEAAAEVARPLYLKARQTAERQAQNQELQKDAAGIPGVTVRMKTIGQTQQLILPVPDLFKRSLTTPRPEKIGILNNIGTLLKKYPDYPVIINGYTNHQVRRAQQYVVSQGRAQQVANHFATMGVPYKRFGISGRGAEELIGTKWAAINNRVEIIILFQ